MSQVVLVSGGLDSTVMTILAREADVEVRPLFVDYGQRAVDEEWKACRAVFRRHKLPMPIRMDIPGFGARIPSGLTSKRMDVVADVYLPGRNLLLLLAGAAYAARVQATGVAIGLLDERQRLFEDQSVDFLERAEALLRTATAREISVRAPLIALSKRAVLELAAARGVRGTYSCHAGMKRPCGRCVSCRERQTAEGDGSGR
jgi:7-cyano-7-deazaguanine synthase